MAKYDCCAKGIIIIAWMPSIFPCLNVCCRTVEGGPHSLFNRKTNSRRLVNIPKCTYKQRSKQTNKYIGGNNSQRPNNQTYERTNERIVLLTSRWPQKPNYDWKQKMQQSNDYVAFMRSDGFAFQFPRGLCNRLKWAIEANVTMFLLLMFFVSLAFATDTPGEKRKGGVCKRHTVQMRYMYF